ncbi:hypothetical protein MPTK1_7g00930 [Marchantia polymorpha subsp. ruderalis]|uniref:Fe2OG dioxygenase domain-containing protein n=2 Tax=Marchantia polymorpha TaxID=3197 RepID=A0AAF6BUW4_MARPO|nr:hypothetical protein MARPO_0046s0031 [Marchantia polymorpha]PTQ39209.1 hypothetical protein MARPO_0046s0031 [Marchantia polymorpha]BBN15797.1 hypothetical protein Mp_7g00930 [Marchantia polymorpha subsp. ruderalis]BBN15798.1 hypothetical protein Mp_7g00930 [Marchantia polymorpha subsp. ruderalis]|eukprot:PTQ39208.1 hypothetical protein MARPO_0046s0031 [Marchantia polymorpha]
MREPLSMAAEVMPSRKKPALQHHHHHNANGQVSSGHQKSLGDEAEREVGALPKLQRCPTAGHKPDKYDDLEDLEYPPALYSGMEQYLPGDLLSASRDKKISFLERILAKYRPNGERARKHREYRERIRYNYQPLHEELYSLDPDRFFDRTFLDAVKDGSEEALRKIITEHSPGVYTFNMLDATFCSMMLEEVEHFENWALEAKVKVMRPNTMNNYGAVLDDIGMEGMLNELMINFINPMAAVLFANVGGSSLDTHHGFVVEYSMDRDLDLGFHVDDSEVTLNVCLGKDFDGGELFFRGVRCDKHVNGESRPEEVLEYSHVPGRAILHAGRHRHGAKAITAGQRTNLILWCRSSEFRELKKYQRDFSSWCGECLVRRKERRRRLSNAKRQLAT